MERVQCQHQNCRMLAQKDGRCRDHYIQMKEVVYLDNSDWDNMGIVKWLKDFYPEHFRDSFPQEHLEVYKMLLELYDPRYTNKMHRMRELIAFREFGKSKIIFGFVSYVTAHNDTKMRIKSTDGKVQVVTIMERVITIFSETGGMAEEFITNIRDEFTTNERLRYFYHFTIRNAKEDDTGQWTKRAFKINGTYLIGLGAGMQARGKIRGAYRITLAFYDDIYSENTVKTEESRLGTKNWFNNSSKNSVDSVEGKILLVGTIVHEDTVLVETQGSSSWRTLKFLPMPLNKFKEFIKKYLTVNLDKKECSLPFENEEEFVKIAKQEAYFKKVQEEEDWGLIWGDRINLNYFALKYKEAVELKSIAGFYQEYFHITIPSELRRFSPEYFQPLPEYHITVEFGYTWFHCKEWYNDEPQVININIGMDVAGGKEESDNAAIVVGGMLPDGKCVILENKYGKYSMRDNINMHDRSLADARYGRIDKIMLDRTQVEKIGYIDEAYRLMLEYHPQTIKVGEGGAENANIVEMRRVFNANNNYVNILPRQQIAHEGKKHERIRETLLPKYETMSFYHRKGLTQLEHELEFLTKAANDDCADAAEVCFFNTLRPQAIPYSMFAKVEKKRKPVLGYPQDFGNNWLNTWRN